MTKFKVGDKVRVINQSHGWGTVSKGDEGVIEKIDKKGTCEVKIPSYSNKITWTGEEHCFELAESKLTKNQRITALENEVAELKLIVHELRGKKSIEPFTTKTVEDIIEFEGDKYRKVDREAHCGDVVIFRINNTSSYQSKTNKPYKVFRPLSENELHFTGDDGIDYLVYVNAHKRNIETTDVYELIKEGLNPQIPMVDETIEPLTPNQQRAEIIEKAKKFVEKYDAVRKGDNHHQEGNRFAKNHWYETDFFVKESKVTAVVYGLMLGIERTRKPLVTDRAKCSPNDVFNEHIGKAIALGRALGLNVSEFEQAVQPTVAIGQIIANKYWNYEVLTLENKNGNLKLADNGTFANGGDLSNRDWYTIINDTNAIYGGVE